MHDMYKNYIDNLGVNHSKYISSHAKYDISSNDIIFMYLKNYKKSGFIGILTVTNKSILNKKNIKIFRDNNLNKYIIKLSQIYLINNPRITISKIFDCIKQDNKSIRSFSKKHICVDNIKKLCYNGEKLLKNIYKLTSEDNNNKYIKKLTRNPRKNVIIVDDIITKKHKKKHKKNNKTKRKKVHKKEHKILNDYMGQIPIMMVPCKNFKLPSHNKKKYFIKHFKTCNKCDKTDNNDISVLTIFDDAHFDFVDVDDPYDIDIDIALQTYDESIGYIPLNINKFPYIRIFEINNDHEIYNNCILISWILKEINYGDHDSDGPSGSDDSDVLSSSDDSDDSDGLSGSDD
uniref:Uncharacterized protein n=1 Tax=Mimivirus LCMiAC02 TaxID=2506609 RepID=A0A481Z185_9VIRU|nr:MAG: hypothetical protein LCMiAC02_05810 [Mimivirus LCMiAC02]